MSAIEEAILEHGQQLSIVLSTVPILGEDRPGPQSGVSDFKNTTDGGNGWSDFYNGGSNWGDKKG